MHATQLRLSGFKSFVEPTEVPIEEGLTGIVGPNGCGKSNLLDALCWVMGEASYKNMRAKSMEGIIFSGTALRPAHNHAEATIVIDNSDHRARAPYRDAETIEITRRIERDSGSSYSINGNPVLAKEARILFADMIGGAHSPFLVHQGRISQLISASPKERRALLDQAAGIGGLRARRREAEIQLKAAEANLERLNDSVTELESRLDALKRQERQAKRYRSLAQRIRSTEGLLLHVRWKTAGEEVAALQESLAEAERVLEEASKEAARGSTALQEADESLQALREEDARCAAGVHRIKMESEQLDAREQQLHERKEGLETRLAQTEKDLEHEAARLQDFQTTSKRLREERETHIAERPGAKRLLQESNEEITKARSQLMELESALEEILERMAQGKAQRDEIEREVARHQERVALLSMRMEEVAEARKSLLEANTEENNPEDQSVQAQRLATLRAREAEAERILLAVRREESHARQAFETHERERQRIETEVEALRELLGETRQGELVAFSAVIHDITVEPSYEKALGASLGDDLDASLDAEAPMRWRVLDPLDSISALPAGAQALGEHIGAPEALARRLSQIGLVAREEGDALQTKLSPGQSLVSPEGDVWRWDGYTATAQATAGATAEKLTRRNHLRELEKSLTQIQAETPDLEKKFRNAQEKAGTAQEEETSVREERRRAEAKFFETRELALQIRQEQQERAARLEALGETAERLREEHAEASRMEADTRDSLANLANGEEVTNDAEELRGRIREARESLAKALARGQSIERESAAHEQRVSVIDEELSSWDERIGAISSQMESLRKRQEESREEITSLAGEPEEIARLREALLQQMSVAESKSKDARDALALGETKRNECARQESSARESAGEAREEWARRGGLLEGARQRLEDTAVSIRREMDCDPENVLEEIAKEGGAVPNTSDSTEVLEERLRRLHAERERLGGVNLRAEDDARETRDRLEAITAERGDLVGAIDRLRKAISRLNREGRERLGKAFEVVEKNFGEIFTRLFGGGSAHLRLLEVEKEEKEKEENDDSEETLKPKESKDVLEAGLEIMARPPGKRPQSLGLLSGGEQTLTALSLIFAVFLANAPPLCVLDEVDAPLDDVNVERFCRLVRDVCKTSGSRILLITHHPLTMARMDRLFGVTMQERGVSRLVSVDLQADGGIRERDEPRAMARG